jgi:RHS repeat-associated protein
VYTGLTNFLSSDDPAPTGYPKAYLNWIFLDDQFNYVSSLSGSVQAASTTYPAATLNTVAPGSQLSLTKSGYLYIWVSNETQGWDVFFDNLSVQYKQGPLLEMNNYYPFGLTMQGLSDKAIKTNYAENKYRYNQGTEMQNKEFSDGTGLEMYETSFRGFDPQLGRFSQIDPMADRTHFFSSYAYANNNPISRNDPTGLLLQDPQQTKDMNNTMLGAGNPDDMDYGSGAPTDPEESNYSNNNFWSNQTFWSSVIPQLNAGGDGSSWSRDEDDAWVTQYANDQTQGQGAWQITNQWNASFISKYNSEVEGIALTLQGQGMDYTCEDFAITCIATFAMQNNLPFAFATGAKTCDASSSEYHNFSDFLADVKTVAGASDLANPSNTTSIYQNDLQAGDLILLDNASTGAAHHAQVVTNISCGDDGSISGVDIVQGNLSIPRWLSSSNPNSWNYGGTVPQNGYWDVENDIFTNCSKNYSIQNYSSANGNCLDFRTWNFLNWNKK